MFLRCLFLFVFLGLRPCLLLEEPNPLTVPLAQENPRYLQVELPFEQRVEDMIARMTLEEKATALNHNGPDLERFGLRSDKWNQCLNGVQWDRPTTLFPCCIAMAATWDPDTIQRQVARVLSDEARAIYNGWRKNPEVPSQHKGLIYRDPVINIGRNPYWGRNHEAWGEDPYLTGRMGVAYVRGLQGDDPTYLKIAATLKHYAVNNVETDRFRLDAKVSNQMLHDYWLPHFREAVVEANASSLMASYNAINGVPNNVNRWLLTEVLKERWGHAGFVVSDLGGVRTMVNGHERNQISYVDAVAKSLMAGCDFSGGEYQQYLPQAVREGKVSEERLNDAVRRVLQVRFRLGEFDPPERIPYHQLSPSIVGCDEHRRIARQVAEKSLVLLKNQNDALPLKASGIQRLAVIGPLADRVVLNNYNGRHANLVSPFAGIREFVGDKIQVDYSMGVPSVGSRQVVGTRIDQETEFSGGASLKLESESVGDFIEFAVAIQEAGEYEIELTYKTFPSRGKFQMSVDGQLIGDPWDMYDVDGAYGKVIELGDTKLKAGLHIVRFTCVGKSPASQGYTGHFDQLRLNGPEKLKLELEESQWAVGRPEPEVDLIEEAVELARRADVAILFVGTDQSIEQEGRDRTSLSLPGRQLELVQAIHAVNPRTVVVLKSAGPLTIPWVDDHVPAVLQAWWGGEEDGTAIANVLFGKVNPAGRLPHTVYASERHVPSLDDYNIDAGFTYMYLRQKPLYAFGHGLSYTNFEYEQLQVDQPSIQVTQSLTVSCKVINAGEQAGDEVVQVYVKCLEENARWPELKLVGFQRIHLKAGETREVQFAIPAQLLARFDADISAARVRTGGYQVIVGRSSVDLPLAREFKVVERPSTN